MTLLFEIGTEELPPSELPDVLPAFHQGAIRMLDDARLSFDQVRVYCTPRRLALVVRGLASAQASQRTTVTGPPKKTAFDAAGTPTRAAEGFARSQGVSVEQLITITTDRGEYLAADRTEPGREARAILPELLGRLVFSLPFAKQMRWGDGDVRFVRPVRWLVALLDGEIMPMTLAGVAADRVTHAHRFLHPSPISLARADDYVARLEGAFVMPDVDARRAAVRTAVETAARDRGHRAVIDDATLETVVHLVEAPVAVVGTFSKASLELPRDVVETPIRRHQRCFPVESADGALAPAFVAVSNMPGVDPVEIRRGNERVIRARLADAEFYFREDLKSAPTDRLRLLEGMVFQERLGTLREKTDRLVALADFLASASPAAQRELLRRAALLAKSDLASGMVREFPELEGLIGEEYAVRAGESPIVARAIREHYLPRSAEDALPQSLEGAVLSLADKTDTVVGCLGVGLIPSGSQDPFAVRRRAQGIVQIAIARGAEIRVSLAATIGRALELLGPKLTETVDATRERALDVFRARLATVLAARGFRPDVVDAVLVAGFDDPLDVVKRVEALTALMDRSDWEPLVITFKRTINILPVGFEGEVQPDRFVHDAERRLDEATRGCRPAVQSLLAAGDYSEALTRLASLRPIVDGFFEAVMVMDQDRAVQQNRLALLKALADLLLAVADLRKIQAAPA